MQLISTPRNRSFRCSAKVRAQRCGGVMANPVNPFLYGLSQTVRTSWFWGHYALAARLAPPMEGAPKETRLPPWRAIMDDLQDLFRRDLANIKAGLYQAPHAMMPRPVRGLRKSAAFFLALAAVDRPRIGRKSGRTWCRERRRT